MKEKIDMVDFLDIMGYLDHLTDTGNLSAAQCVADEFDLSPELGEWAVREWQKVEKRKRKESDVR